MSYLQLSPLALLTTTTTLRMRPPGLLNLQWCTYWFHFCWKRLDLISTKSYLSQTLLLPESQVTIQEWGMEGVGSSSQAGESQITTRL
jgi:hypothetical protein